MNCTWETLFGDILVPNISDLILIQYEEKKKNQKLEESKAMCLATKELGSNGSNSGKKHNLEKM